MARRTPLDPERAWDYLLDLLTRRDYTEAELRQRLERRGIAGEDAGALLARLQELGLLNDARFAERWVASRSGARGRLALSAELRRKGVASELVEAELDPLSDAHQREAAIALLRRFAWRYRPEPDPDGGGGAAGPNAAGPVADGRDTDGRDTDGDAARAESARARQARLRGRARAFAFLARRGFSPDVAGAALEAVGWWRDETA